MGILPAGASAYRGLSAIEKESATRLLWNRITNPILGQSVVLRSLDDTRQRLVVRGVECITIACNTTEKPTCCGFG